MARFPSRIVTVNWLMGETSWWERSIGSIPRRKTADDDGNRSGWGGDWSIFRPENPHLAAGRKAENMDLSPWHCPVYPRERSPDKSCGGAGKARGARRTAHGVCLLHGTRRVPATRHTACACYTAHGVCLLHGTRRVPATRHTACACYTAHGVCLLHGTRRVPATLGDLEQAITIPAGNAFRASSVVVRWPLLATLRSVRRSHVEPRGPESSPSRAASGP